MARGGPSWSAQADAKRGHALDARWDRTGEAGSQDALESLRDSYHTRRAVREPTVRPDRSRLCAAVILKGLRAPDEFGNGESTAPDCSAHDADWRMSRGQCLAIQACGTIRSSDLVSRGQLPFWRQSRALLIAGQLTHELRPTPMKAPVRRCGHQSRTPRPS